MNGRCFVRTSVEDELRVHKWLVRGPDRLPSSYFDELKSQGRFNPRSGLCDKHGREDRQNF